VCSPLNSPATNRIINLYKHYRNTKLLLIDIIGNVFSYENQIYRNFNRTSDYDNLLVLTILTDRFKYILNSKYHVEFGRYLSLETHHANESIAAGICELKSFNVSGGGSNNNGSNYGKLSNDIAHCQREIKEHCGNRTSDDIESFCVNISNQQRRENAGDKLHLNKQLVVSEHFNLFDFVTSLLHDTNSNDHREPFDFIVLNFQSIVMMAFNETRIIWRPTLILQHTHFDKNLFIMHHALSDHPDDAAFEDWMKTTSANLWKCGTFCWAIIAGILLILIGLILLISLSAGIAAR